MGLASWLKRGSADPVQELKKVLGDYDLPSFPGVIMKALSVLRDEDGSLQDVATELALDPGVSAKLLSLSNSASIGLRHPVKNLDHAVSILGRRELEPFLLGVAVSGRLPREACEGFEAGRFWAAAARRASVARALAGLAAPAHRSDCFTAALLADMAIPLLAKVKAEAYTPLLQQWHDGERELEGSEQEAFGWTHAQVAGWMCEKWEFPQALSHAIATHHDDSDDSRAHVSVCLAAELRETDGPEALATVVDGASELLHLPGSRVEDAVGEAFENASEISQLFGR